MGSFVEFERRFNALGAPVAIDPKGFFPGNSRWVTIEVEGGEPVHSEIISGEPVWAVVATAICFSAGRAFVMHSPEHACEMFSIMEWDAAKRRLKVKLN